LLIEAFPSVVDRAPLARLLIVGDGPLRDELEAQVPASFRNSVHFLGTRSDIPQIMAASDVVVLPSSYEPFGMVLVEAMAAARPVIGTRVDGIPELIDDGITGLLVPPDDSVALSDAILRILLDESGAQSMRAAGQRNSTRFDIRTSAALLRDLYHRLYANYELRYSDPTRKDMKL
jgi:glycosyltransferase involved in cell wall biosynthesis